MSGGAPVPVPVKGEDAVVLCMEDIKERADANLPEVARGTFNPVAACLNTPSSPLPAQLNGLISIV